MADEDSTLCLVPSKWFLIVIGLVLTIIFGVITTWAYFSQHPWLQVAFAGLFCIGLFATPMCYLKMRCGNENVHKANMIVLGIIAFLVLAMICFWVFSIVSAPDWMKEGMSGLLGGIIGAFIYEIIPKKDSNDGEGSHKI
jgi:hypothetical protein